jgi:hypothetical protein
MSVTQSGQVLENGQGLADSSYYKAHFTPGVKANLQLKSSIPIGGKVEISPKGFTLRESKAEIEKNIFQSPPSY